MVVRCCLWRELLVLVLLVLLALLALLALLVLALVLLQHCSRLSCWRRRRRRCPETGPGLASQEADHQPVLVWIALAAWC